jgi:hypothetical protein
MIKNMNKNMKKNMKRNIFLSCLMACIIGLSSCEDILTVDSARYVTVDDNTLTSPNDSVASILGLLRNLQDVAERYVLFGEMRADLLDVTEYTSAAIRQLSDFTVDPTGEYADPRDYYTIINNCNYFISRTSGENHVLANENAVARSIRAWTYMQIAFNWGKAYYFTEPILSVKDEEKNFPAYTIPQLIDALITDLEPFAEADYPNFGTIYEFSSTNLFFPIKVLLGDLYLWRGGSVDDYEKAANYYVEYIDHGRSMTNVYTPVIQWTYDNFIQQNFETSYPQNNNWTGYTYANNSNYELITAVQMATEAENGKITQLWQKIEQYRISEVANTLWDDQIYVLRQPTSTGYTNYYTMGDCRKLGNNYTEGSYASRILNGVTVRFRMVRKMFNMEHFMLYRMVLIHLRYAEAVNRAGKPHTAFAVLKYGLNSLTLADNTRIPQEELADAKPYITIFNDAKYLQTNTIGVHARGCGDAEYNPFYYIGWNGWDTTLETLSDTIQWVEEAICTELALETSFEGNRYQDLMRMAMRRNDPSFLAKRVAAKHGTDEARIYNLLLDTKNWFLPEPAR